jgi:2-(1,2-epoxy-1,2-dihydrophenyl)acetyl-CoA isomerase
VSRAGAAGFDTRSTSEALRAGVQALVRELWELDKPTVAAVNGVAVGPGAHLALACDFVLVHERTRLMWSFARWGLVVDAGGAYLLPRLVGLPRAKAMVLLGEGATGDEAVRDGLAYRCVADAALLATEAEALAQRLAAGPTRALGLSKVLLNRSFESDIASSLDLEGAYQALATTSTDLAEGMAAFKEKRDPNFTGQ